jgi:hypothetical protein
MSHRLELYIETRYVIGCDFCGAKDYSLDPDHYADELAEKGWCVSEPDQDIACPACSGADLDMDDDG